MGKEERNYGKGSFCEIEEVSGIWEVADGNEKERKRRGELGRMENIQQS